MGKPVITTKYSGLDDGHTEMWSLPITDYVFEEINLPNDPAINGDWVKVDIDDLGELMRWCYENREKAANYGQNAAQWLRENQTWDQAARAMTTLLQEYV
jgi:glycosyltransferase involved in cell wall biosynthesis